MEDYALPRYIIFIYFLLTGAKTVTVIIFTQHKIIIFNQMLQRFDAHMM